MLGVVALAGAFDSGKRLQPGLNVIKLFISEIYEFLSYAGVFVPGKYSLLFAGKAEAYPSEVPFKCFTLG